MKTMTDSGQSINASSSLSRLPHQTTFKIKKGSYGWKNVSNRESLLLLSKNGKQDDIAPMSKTDLENLIYKYKQKISKEITCVKEQNDDESEDNIDSTTS